MILKLQIAMATVWVLALGACGGSGSSDLFGQTTSGAGVGGGAPPGSTASSGMGGAGGTGGASVSSSSSSSGSSSSASGTGGTGGAACNPDPNPCGASECGEAPDGCGKNVKCGKGCFSNQVCTTERKCCLPKTTCEPGKCGPQPDGCGGMMLCDPTCGGTEWMSCGATGTCECKPATDYPDSAEQAAALCGQKKPYYCGEDKKSKSAPPGCVASIYPGEPLGVPKTFLWCCQ